MSSAFNLLWHPYFKIGVQFILGIFCGLSVLTLHLSNAVSYLSDEPQTCMNCHVMRSVYATWQKSGHRHVSTCIDCHVPHNNIIAKWFFKAQDGLRHATIFTFRLEPQVIKIKEMGQRAVKSNCIRCHVNVVSKIRIDEQRNCWFCHREVPHGRVHSLSATPYARIPKLSSPVPKWLELLFKT